MNKKQVVLTGAIAAIAGLAMQNTAFANTAEKTPSGALAAQLRPVAPAVTLVDDASGCCASGCSSSCMGCCGGCSASCMGCCAGGCCAGSAD